METQKKQYIGPNEVIGIVLHDKKTIKGNDIVKIIYSTSDLPLGSITIMPLKTFELLVSEQPTDWEYIRNKQIEAMQSELAVTIMEWDIMYDDIKTLLTGMAEKLFTAFDRATHFLWTKDDKSFAPGRHSAIGFRTLLEADEILKTISDNKEDGESTGKTE